MTQANINAMNKIRNRIEEGETFSQALKSVYHKRHVSIPYNDEWFNVSVMSLGMSPRATNALMRAKLIKVSDVVNYCQTKKITEIVNLGEKCGIEIFESILDYCWKCMDDNARTKFLTDTVERNSCYLRV